MHILRCLTLLMLMGWCCLPTTLIQAKETAVRVGQGSFTTVLPAGAKEPQAEIYRTDQVRGPMPTNDWWSSLAWAGTPTASTRIRWPCRPVPPGCTSSIPARRLSLAKSDLRRHAGPWRRYPLGHAAQDEFPDARVDAYSDWLVTVLFAAGRTGCGSPTGTDHPSSTPLERGDPQLTFREPPEVWSGSERDPVWGSRRWQALRPVRPGRLDVVGVGTKHWSITAAANRISRWRCCRRIGGDARPLSTYAYAHVVDTQVTWQYDAASEPS